ncbi:putative P450 monooxygenase [Xylariales sp. PMI_506]|nr:putative P450 monooxygenase [Xylariales sp. PMI_506]
MAISLELLSAYPNAPYILAALVFFVPLAYYGTIIVYNIWFHPLSAYPGPWLAAATPMWYGVHMIRGDAPMSVAKVHDRYGPVVRIAPDELSFISGRAWKDIYGHRKPGEPEFTKDKKYHAGFDGDATLINSNREYHSYLRKLLSHGFSDSALRQQETIIQDYLEKLINQLYEKGQSGEVALDLSRWYNYFTFDVIAYLTYGDSFDFITNSKMHNWINAFFSVVRVFAAVQASTRLPKLIRIPFLTVSVPRDIKHKANVERDLTQLKIKHRLQTAPAVPDFMAKLIDAHRQDKMTFNQLFHNSRILMGAGSETTAASLSAMTYLLMTHPVAMEKLKAEIRDTFHSADEITMTRVNSCRYLLACLEECLRMYPPSPANHPRYVPAGGATVDGHFLPADVAVGTNIYGACRSAANFANPDTFAPERWLPLSGSGGEGGGDPIYEHDQRDAAQPFSLGPRNCIGRNLAYVEMKMVMARVLFHFDLENCVEGNWLDQKVYMVWDRPPLMVKLRPVNRDT